MGSDYSEEHGYNDTVFDSILSDTLDLKGFEEYLHKHRSVERYTSGNEKKLDHDWWKLNKTEVDSQIRELAQLVVTIVDGHPPKDTELGHLYRVAKALSQVERSPPIKVGIIGAQAVGKSLFTNALFGKSGLSPTGADGKACTSSVISYKNYREDNSTASKGTFHAFVSFLNATKRRAIIEEHANSYYLYTNNDDDLDKEGDSDASADTVTEFDRSAMKTAEEFFATIFGSLEEFLNNWSAYTYKSGEFSILCEMKCNEAISTANADIAGDVCTFMGKSHQDLMKQIKPFIVKVNGKVCLWPLVDKVSVSFCDEILEQNVEIFDVPGWGDTNSARARHYEDIRETLDVEIILADSLRAGTDKTAIDNARTGVDLHGAGKVKIVATKIDSVSEDRLEQCEGPFYDRMRSMIEEIEERQEDQDEHMELLPKYQIYLRRQRKKAFIKNRTVNMTKDISKEFTGSTEADIPEVYHVSASEFMNWIKTKKISFDNIPTLTAEETSIPTIRQLLMGLPAEQNLEDYRHHIDVLIPAFISKIERTVSDADRDEGFREIAEKVDEVRITLVDEILNQAKAAFDSISGRSIIYMTQDNVAYKHQIDSAIQNTWLIHKGKAFEKVMKCHGLVPPGASSAKTLKDGCNLNKDLADILQPGFVKWDRFHDRYMADMAPALDTALQHVHQKIIDLIQHSDANVVVIEKAKRKFKDVPMKMSAKLTAMMNKIVESQKRAYSLATGKSERNFISCVTDEIFKKVFAAVPDTREVTAGKNKGSLVPVCSKIKCQQDLLKSLTTRQDEHLIDAIIYNFRRAYDRKINVILTQSFQQIGSLLGDFCESMKKESPLIYKKEPLGENMREKLGKQLPMIREAHSKLQQGLPSSPKLENDETDIAVKKPSEGTVSEILERLSSKRKLGIDTGKEGTRVKKEKL